MRVAWAALLVAASVGGGAAAQDPCAGTATQAQVNLCARKYFEEADRELNRVYADAVRVAQGVDYRGDGGPEALLREAQRAWVAFRDAACAAEAAPYEGGTVQPSIRWGCMERLTWARSDDLYIYTSQGGG